MKQEGLLIRPAVKADAPFVMARVAEAVGMDTPPAGYVRKMSVLCETDDVLYSYSHTLVAEWDGKPVGALVSYPGAMYKEWRGRTFEMVKALTGNDYSGMADETREGEYYIDSLATAPSARGRGVGRALLRAGIERARSMRIPVVTLAVDPDNPPALGLYRSMGFEERELITIFDHLYRRMELPLRF